MLTQVADGVFVHESEFIRSNSTVLRGAEGRRPDGIPGERPEP